MLFNSTSMPDNTPKNQSVHTTVLKDETLHWLSPTGDYHGKTFIDGTFGGGGITEELLKKGANVLAIDQDASAFERRQDLSELYPQTFIPVHANFDKISSIIEEHHLQEIHGITLDLGLSSDQLDTPERGFAYRTNGPLDMRMNPAHQDVTAADLLNTLPESQIADLFYLYGDEKKSRRLANMVITARKTEDFTTTPQLVNIIETLYPAKIGQRRSHPALRLFQALRIAVNHELSALEAALPAAAKALAPNGHLAIVTFHSLEERIVKQTYKTLTATSHDQFGRITQAPKFRIPLRKAKPSEKELEENNRARSGTLRVLQKI